ncbi:carbohydrate sulfotransferase 15-like [Ylistrum balloti]|uniref:carbohydrate sulfotransferase 15-like n=1 Tax=Ylistrum balloti TaxID=509963 RepID=UPI0029058445|nr:carbohydrate sulfotransferase 15-like [Ylistrum balloti]
MTLISRSRTGIALVMLCTLLFTFHVLTRDVKNPSRSDPWIHYSDNSFRAENQRFTSIEECRENFEQRNRSRQWFWSPSYRNPCWTNNKGELGCVPYFFVLGFPKCGTTDLFERIKLHPGYVPPLFKEIHWITRYRFFPLSRDAKGQRTRDFSPSTIWDTDLYMQLPENKDRIVPVLTPGNFVYDMNPCAKLIIMLRNPVNRLYSDYLHFYNRKSPQHFHDIVISTIDLYKDCFRKWGIRPCVHHYYLEATGKARLRLGIYYIYISDWLEKFPRDQFLFIRLEDYAVDTKSHLQEIFHYLDLPPTSEDLLNEMSSAAPKNTRQDRKEDSDAPPMLPETRVALEQFYAPYNKKLAILLNDKRYDW